MPTMVRTHRATTRRRTTIGHELKFHVKGSIGEIPHNVYKHSGHYFLIVTIGRSDGACRRASGGVRVGTSAFSHADSIINIDLWRLRGATVMNQMFWYSCALSAPIQLDLQS